MTDIFTFSGVHGSGKTTIINYVANRLTNIGKRVFVLNEFPYIPEITIGTMDFQAWYQNAMEQRNRVVKLIAPQFNIVLLDRHPLDVDVYTSRLLDDRVDTTKIEDKVSDMERLWINSTGFGRDDIEWKTYAGIFLLERPYEDLVNSIKHRRKTDVHRKEWHEDDREYLMHIINEFRKFKENSNVIFIENKDLDDTKDLVFQHIVQRIKK